MYKTSPWYFQTSRHEFLKHTWMGREQVENSLENDVDCHCLEEPHTHDSIFIYIHLIQRSAQLKIRFSCHEVMIIIKDFIATWSHWPPLFPDLTMKSQGKLKPKDRILVDI